MTLKIPALPSQPRLLLAALIALGMTACGGPSTPAPEAAVADQSAAAATDEAATEEAAAEQEAADQAAADLAAREEELAAREAELAAREQALQEQKTATAKPPAKTSTPAKTASTAKPAAAAPAATPPPPPPPPVTVGAGTPVGVKLNSAYSTKTTLLGETVNAELASDLVVGDRVVAKAGAPISGSVTEVTSGSKKIGAVPALKIDFTQLAMADGTRMAVAIRVNQKGQSEKGRDTAKIVGGTAAGAIIGHQIDDDKGKVIGGIVGGAAGAIAAQKTGTEVELPAGSVVSATVRTPFTYSGR